MRIRFSFSYNHTSFKETITRTGFWHAEFTPLNDYFHSQYSWYYQCLPVFRQILAKNLIIIATEIDTHKTDKLWKNHYVVYQEVIFNPEEEFPMTLVLPPADENNPFPLETYLNSEEMKKAFLRFLRIHQKKTSVSSH